ncbi:YdcF family protein [Labedella endophytica]|uniref:YdcF family protein n=1 Tax=Labedella endophytica TaxID=1523160 RepID=A0A433JMR1_9MICO|nr:YdcF family protein [Labedella endophytica]
MAVVAGATAVLGGILWSERVTWRASLDAIPPAGLDPRARPGDVVLVLGFRSSAHGRVNLIQRWRVRIAARTADPETATFVFSGGATRGALSEAALMARFAVERAGIPERNVVLEEESRTTWENIAFSLPFLRDAGSIAVASNTFHARRARRYLATQAPELAARLRRGADYRFGEFLLVKPYLAIYEWRRSRLRPGG